MSNIASGYCHCGCGQKTKLADKNCKRDGHIKGAPLKYIYGHRPSKGGKIGGDAYLRIRAPFHPRAVNGYVREHILIVEKAFGKSLPKTAVIHHYTADQLVVCQDNAYHKLLHQRQRAFEACGHASWRKCWICGKYDDPLNPNLYINKNHAYHRSCNKTKYPAPRRTQA